jgi:sugar phosphate permease
VSATADETDPHRQPWRWVVFGACTPLFVCSQFFRVANAIVAPQLQAELGLDSEALGGLSAAFFYAFAAMQIPLALVLDRIGARAVMAALTLTGAAGAVVFGTAHGHGAALAGEVLLGVGMAANLVGSMKLVAQWFSPREFATVAGAFGALGTLGNILATTPLALLVEAVGWRGSFLAFSAVAAALALAFLALAREPARAPAAAGGAAPAGAPLASSVRRLLSTREYWLISFAAFCRYGAFVSVQALWAGPYLVEIAGLSPVRAANLILVLNLSFVVGAPLGGWLSDRVLGSRKQPVLVALAGTALALVALALAGTSRPAWALALVLAALGVTSSFGQVVWAHIKGLMPAPMAGMAMTGMNFFNMLGAAAFLHGSGWVLERWAGPGGARGADGYRAAFLASASLVAVALSLYAFTRDARVEGAPRGPRSAAVPGE